MPVAVSSSIHPERPSSTDVVAFHPGIGSFHWTGSASLGGCTEYSISEGANCEYRGGSNWCPFKYRGVMLVYTLSVDGLLTTTVG